MEGDTVVTLSTGVKLRIKDVPIGAFGIIKSQMHQERPTVPMIFIKDKDREEQNPDDPDYKAAMEDWDERVSQRLLDASIMLGSEIDTVPDKYPKPDDDDWAKKLSIIGIDVPPKDKKNERYLAWVKCLAAPTASDIGAVMTAAARRVGVAEEDVAAQAESFPCNEE